MTDRLIDRCGNIIRSPFAIVLLLLLVAFIIRIFGIGDAPLRTDEVYHLLAGRSWAEHGTLALGEGVYTRARYYSMATGWFFDLFGTSPAVGRSLAAIAGTALVGMLALWTYKMADAEAAWVAGLLLCFNYTGIAISQFARFYTWHALAMLVLAIAVYAVVTQWRATSLRRLLAWAIIALLALAGGLHLQATTIVMVIALSVWVGAFLLLTGRLDFILRSRVLFGSVVILAGIGMVVLLYAGGGVLRKLWLEFRGASAWSVENQDDALLYLRALTHLMGWLFVLLPVAAILAWRRYRQPMLFCAVIVTICLALHSLAGMKAVRYVFYVFPFIFAIWGLAVSAVARPCLRFLLDSMPASLGAARPIVLGGGLLLLLGAAFVTVTDYRLTATAAVRVVRTGSPAQTFAYGAAREEVDWTPHLPLLRSLVRNGLFIATDSVRTIYYLRDYDILLSKTELSDIGPHEFLRDKRTGKRDISTGRSIDRVIRCYPEGTILVSDARWRSANVTDEAADVIERETTPVKLPAGLNMRAYRWRHPPAPPSADCTRIRALIGKLQARA